MVRIEYVLIGRIVNGDLRKVLAFFDLPDHPAQEAFGQVLIRGAGQQDLNAVSQGKTIGVREDVQHAVLDIAVAAFLFGLEVKRGDFGGPGQVILLLWLGKTTGKTAFIKSAVVITLAGLAHIHVVEQSLETSVGRHFQGGLPGADTAHETENDAVHVGEDIISFCLFGDCFGLNFRFGRFGSFCRFSLGLRCFRFGGILSHSDDLAGSGFA